MKLKVEAAPKMEVAPLPGAPLQVRNGAPIPLLVPQDGRAYVQEVATLYALTFIASS